MSETVTVELARACDAPKLAAELNEHGFETDVDGCELRVRYADDRLRDDVGRALESWVAREGVPLVPVDCGDHTFALRPPGD